MSAAQNPDLRGTEGRKPFIGLYFMFETSLAAVNNQGKLQAPPAEGML